MLSTFAAILAAALIQWSTYYIRIAGILIWFLAYVLDFCDGEIARYRNMQTEFGHWLDVVSDRLKDVALFTAVTLLAVRESQSTIAVLTGLLALGGTMVYAYSVSASDQGKEFDDISPDRFGNANYVLMAILVVLNRPIIFLCLAAVVTFAGLSLKLYSARRKLARRDPNTRCT